MSQLIGSIFCWHATLPENSFIVTPLKANFPFDDMPKKEVSGLVACQQKIDPISCGTVLKLRLPDLRACPSMWDFSLGAKHLKNP